mgnify:CR=1 FL=1
MGGVSTCFALLILCVSRVALKASDTWTIRISLGPVAAASGGVTHGGRGLPRAWLGGAATAGALLLASRGCGISTRAIAPGGEYPVEDITLIPPGKGWGGSSGSMGAAVTTASAVLAAAAAGAVVTAAVATAAVVAAAADIEPTVSGAVGACCCMLATEMVSAVSAELAAAMPVAVMPPMAVADWVRGCWVPGSPAAAAARESVGTARTWQQEAHMAKGTGCCMKAGTGL